MNNQANSFRVKNVCSVHENVDSYQDVQENCLQSLPLAYSYVPVQSIGDVYTYPEALNRGTLFPELYKPIKVYGYEFCTGGTQND